MKEKLMKVLGGNAGKNRILPFFWQHGESDEALLTELRKIYESGIGAVCVESRPHKDFGRSEWFDDMRLMLEECRRLGMEFWLLDDQHFPTGFAAGMIRDKYPEKGKRAVTERHTDVAGPMKDCAVLCGDWLGEEDRLLGVVACERAPGTGQKLAGRTIDLSGEVDDGIVFFDVPPGHWRVFTIFETPVKDNYIDMLDESSVDVLIEAVYEPHYRELGEYFGNTFRGFFSDEPFVMNKARLPVGGECCSKGLFPWNENVAGEMCSRLGKNWIEKLPALWFPAENAPEVRLAYMDAVTELYSRCFTYRLGNWARSRGVEYIGHIVEDDGMHSRLLAGAGHFFRALDGQDMAGIDVVLCQIVPGMADCTISVPCWYDVADHEFFHYTLAHLASSHAQIQPGKKGRAMCEIFGAYGWAEGLPMMKWLTDHMLVRGINHFVPHAFSPTYPDYDCPPHFFAGGHNPEFRGFGTLMGYMNRVSELLCGEKRVVSAAVVYHAEAEWSGGAYMKSDRPARLLTEGLLDFDIVPVDYLSKAEVTNGRAVIGTGEYPVVVAPYAEVISSKIVGELGRLAKAGVRVIFVNGLPRCDELGSAVFAESFDVASEDELASAVRLASGGDVSAKGENVKNLRFCHASDSKEHVYFVTNEGVGGSVTAEVRFSAFSGGEYVRYYPLENRAERCFSRDGSISLGLAPYNSAAFFFGDIPGEIPPCATVQAEELPVCELLWRVSTAAPETWTPSEKLPEEGVFSAPETVSGLFNMARRNPRFAGFIRYETELDLHEGRYTLDLGCVGEAAYVWANGRFAGERIVPEYRFEFEAFEGKNLFTAVTVSHLGYQMRDGFSRYLAMEPVGLLGPVRLEKHM